MRKKHLGFFWFILTLFFNASIVLANNDYWAPSVITPRELGQGNGAVVFKIKYYQIKDGYKLDPAKKFKDFDDLISQAGKEKKLGKRIDLNALRLDKVNKGESFKIFDDLSWAVLFSPPGERTISAMSVFAKNGWYETFRIFTKIKIEPGKIKYAGEWRIFDPNRIGFVKAEPHRSPMIKYHYLPDEFRTVFEENFPQLVTNLISEPLSAQSNETFREGQ